MFGSSYDIIEQMPSKTCRRRQRQFVLHQDTSFPWNIQMSFFKETLDKSLQFDSDEKTKIFKDEIFDFQTIKWV